MLTLYSMNRGGNSYKARLALALLNRSYRLIEIDILRGESRTPQFLAINPIGQVPVLEVAPDEYIAESNAILWYLADGTALVPNEALARAHVLQWMFFEQHGLEPHLGSAYFWLALIKGGRELHAHSLESWMERGYRALKVMEHHLQRHSFFAAERFTIADIALFATTDLAEEGDFKLSAFPAINAWRERVAALPGFVTMNAAPRASSASTPLPA